MQRINVGLGERTYPIYIGSGLEGGRLVREALPKVRDVMVVSNDTVAPLYMAGLRAALEQQGFRTDECILKDGEEYKTSESWMQIITALLEKGFSRDGALIALGGGVVGDIAGFAAACYQRGIAYIQYPTTLLAMVDSSVGGKTAINHPLGKNMIGAFYQPKAVLADIACLKSLPERQLAAGMGEVVKTGIIYDSVFFAKLEECCDRVFSGDAETLEYIVRRCCEIKAEVVSQDEHEHGLRAILNLGHTFGHAVEAYLGYGTWLHGEAVGLGMVMAAELAVKRELLSEEERDRIVSLIRRCRLPVTIPAAMQGRDFLKLMRHDKKVRRGVIRYVLPEGLGMARVIANVGDAEVLELTEELKVREL